MTSKVILVSGKKRSGKDFTASLLRDELIARGKTVAIMSFAEPMKDIIYSIFEVSFTEGEALKNQLEPIDYGFKVDRDTREHSTTMRKLLQRFGTDTMKKYFGDDVWSELLYKRAESIDADYVLVPDFRFKCEDHPRATTIRINSNKCDMEDTHPSETELDDYSFDYVLDNSDYKLNKERISIFVDRLIKI